MPRSSENISCNSVLRGNQYPREFLAHNGFDVLKAVGLGIVNNTEIGSQDLGATLKLTRALAANGWTLTVSSSAAPI